MIRRSTWLVLCLCGLLVMMLGCKKAAEKGLSIKTDVEPPPSASNQVPPPPSGTETAPPASHNLEVPK